MLSAVPTDNSQAFTILLIVQMVNPEDEDIAIHALDTFRVIGTVTGTTAADTSVVTIVKPAVMLNQVLLNPSQANVPAGATQQFSVTGLYSDGSTGTPAVTWTARGGTITAGGLYTAGKTQGTYFVIATEQGGSRSDTSAVVVGPPALTQLVLNPSTVSLLSGQSAQFLRVSTAHLFGAPTVLQTKRR